MQGAGRHCWLGGRRAFAFAFLALVALASSARAQDAQPEGPDSQTFAGRAAAAAARVELPSLAPDVEVTYAEVLENPDDPRLNYLYAQTLIRRGELRGAAATLDRILLLHPELPRVRLLYATVLFRLDDRTEAEREFRALERYEMTPELRRTVARYLAAIERRKRRSRYSLSTTFGSQYDSNRNAGPRSDELLFQGQRFGVADVSREEDDLSFVGVIDLRAERDLESQEGHRLLGGLSYYFQEQVELDELDLQAVTGHGGGWFRTPWGNIEGIAYGSLMTLSSETFLRRGGARFRARHPVTPRSAVLATTWLEMQDFDDVPRSETLSDRSGVEWGAEAGGEWRFRNGHAFEAMLTGLRKNAEESFWKYWGAGARLRYTWPLSSGQFLSGAAWLQWDRYDDADPLVDPRRRRDLRTRQQLLYGVPLRILLRRPDMEGPLSDLLVTTIAEYFRSASNLTNYSYDNWRVSLFFTKRIEF